MFDVKVVQLPFFLFELSNVTISSPDKTVDAECLAFGYPEPKLHWAFGNKKIVEGFNLPLDASSRPGKYTCIVENEAGRIESSIYFNVKAKLKFLDGFKKSKSTKQVREHSNVELLCPFNNYDEISWEKDGKKMENQSSDRLELESADETSSGEYKCVVTDGQSEEFYAYKVEVLTHPKIISKNIGAPSVLEELTVEAGKSLELECKTWGNPRPEVSWWKSNEIISRGDLFKIMKVEMVDRGNLFCKASNNQGSVEKVFKIDVTSAPFIEESENKVSIEKLSGEQTLLNCSIGGSPQPQFIWFKEG